MIPLGKRPQDRYAVLISRHGDGGINAAACESFGIRPIRASGGKPSKMHRRGGVFGLREMLRALQQGDNVTLTADIPKKARIAGLGIVTLARMSGRPIIPAAVVHQPPDHAGQLGPNLHRAAFRAGRGGHRRAHPCRSRRRRRRAGSRAGPAGARARRRARPRLPARRRPRSRARRCGAPCGRGPRDRAIRFRFASMRPGPACSGPFARLAARAARPPRQGGAHPHRRAPGRAERGPPARAPRLAARRQRRRDAVARAAGRAADAARPFNVLVTSGTVTSARLLERRLPPGASTSSCRWTCRPMCAASSITGGPTSSLIAESEIWPNMLHGARTARHPARAGQRPHVGAQLPPLAAHARHDRARVLSRFDLCLAQIDGRRRQARPARRAARRRGRQPQIRRAAPAGRPAAGVGAERRHRRPPALDRAPRPIRARRRSSPPCTAPSRRIFPGLLTIIAPRHPERGAEIAEIAADCGPARRRSARAGWSRTAAPTSTSPTPWASSGSSTGSRRSCSSASRWWAHGGQNPIEPAKLGAAILHGPHVQNFADVYAALDARRRLAGGPGRAGSSPARCVAAPDRRRASCAAWRAPAPPPSRSSAARSTARSRRSSPI